jgi:hypothetical protein
VTQLSDLEHLVALADMMGGYARIQRIMRQWYVSAWTDGNTLLAMGEAPTMQAAVLACLAKLRQREGA